MNSIKYEDRFEGLLPKEAFPLPLPGLFQKRAGPPADFDKLLTMAEQILSGQPNVQWKTWPRPPGRRSKGIVSVAIKSELAGMCDASLIVIRQSEQHAQPRPKLDGLRTMVDRVKTWDVPALTVKAYRERAELKKWLMGRGWKDSVRRDTDFNRLVSLSHLDKIVEIIGKV